MTGDSPLLPHVTDDLDRIAGRVRAASMAELTHGTRVRHIAWECAGTIRVTADVTEVRWDGSAVADEVSPEGVVFPDHLEIIGGTR